MADQSTNFNWDIPIEFSDPYYAQFVTMINQIDAQVKINLDLISDITLQASFEASTAAVDDPTIDLDGSIYSLEDVANAPGERIEQEVRASSVLATTDDGNKAMQCCFPGSGFVFLTAPPVYTNLHKYNAASMAFVETFSALDGVWGYAVKVVGDFVYGFRNSTFRKRNIHTGALEIGNVDGPSSASGMAYNGGTIFVSHRGETWSAVAVTVSEWDAETGVLDDYYNLAGIGSATAYDVEVDDDFIYILDGTAGEIRKYDRATKTEQDQVAVTGGANDQSTLNIVGDYIYFCAYDGVGDDIVYKYDTATLTLQSQFTLPKSVAMSNVHNGVVYSADNISAVPAADKISFPGLWYDKDIGTEKVVATNISWQSGGNTRPVSPEDIERNADNINGLKLPNVYADFDTTLAAPPYREGRVFYDSVKKTIAGYNDKSDVTIQWGREVWIRGCNNTGVQINNGQVVCITGQSGGCPDVVLADADNYDRNIVLAVATMNVPDGEEGEFTRIGIVNDIDTSSFTAGDTLYLSITPGALTNVRPQFPAKPIIVGHCLVVDATVGNMLVIISSDQYDYEFDGCCIQQQDYEIVVDGGVVYADVELNGGGDLPVQLNGQVYLLDCTTGAGVGGKARVALTAGTDIAPQENFFHAILSGGNAILASSTVQATGSFAPVGRCSLWSAAKTVTDNVAGNRRTTDAIEHNDKGRIHYIDDRLRDLGAAWKTGVNPTATITTLGGSLDTVNFEVLAGKVKQVHLQDFPALSIDTSGIYVANASGAGSLTKYQKITGLEQALETVDGTAISGSRFNQFIFGVINMKTSQCKLYLNLPTGVYGTNEAAYRDSSQYSPTNADASIAEYAFAIGRVPLRHQTTGSGTITFINGVGQSEIVDMRGVAMNTSATGVGGASGATQLSELTDVVISTPVDDNLLVYDSGLWLNKALTLDEVADTATRVAITPAQETEIGLNTAQRANAETIWDVPVEVVSIPDSNRVHVAITRENLLIYSADLTADAIGQWEEANCVTGGVSDVIATAATTVHSRFQSYTFDGSVYTLSMTITGLRTDWARIAIAYGASVSYLTANVSDGTIGNQQGLQSYRSVRQADGSYRLSIQVNSGVDTGSVIVYPASSGSSVSYLGNGVDPDVLATDIQLCKCTIDELTQYKLTTTTTHPKEILLEKEYYAHLMHADSYVINAAGTWIRIEDVSATSMDESPSNVVALEKFGYKKRLDNNLWETPQSDVVYYNGTKSAGSDVYYVKTSGTLSAASTAIITGLTISELLSVQGYGTSDDGLTQYQIGSDDLKVTVTLSGGSVNLIGTADLYGSSNPFFAAVTFI